MCEYSQVQLEFCNAIKLLKDVNGWLDELSRVLQGSALLTPDVLALGSALDANEWSKPDTFLRETRSVAHINHVIHVFVGAVEFLSCSE